MGVGIVQDDFVVIFFERVRLIGSLKRVLQVGAHARYDTFDQGDQGTAACWIENFFKGPLDPRRSAPYWCLIRLQQLEVLQVCFDSSESIAVLTIMNNDCDSHGPTISVYPIDVCVLLEFVGVVWNWYLSIQQNELQNCALGLRSLN